MVGRTDIPSMLLDAIRDVREKRCFYAYVHSCKTRHDSHVMTHANSQRYDRFGYTRLMGLISEKP